MLMCGVGGSVLRGAVLRTPHLSLGGISGLFLVCGGDVEAKGSFFTLLILNFPLPSAAKHLVNMMMGVDCTDVHRVEGVSEGSMSMSRTRRYSIPAPRAPSGWSLRTFGHQAPLPPCLGHS